MSMKGKTAWNKGKSFPHSPEWEAKRIVATREASKRRQYPSGYHRSDREISPMRTALEIARTSDPERFKRLSIENLPKDNSGSKNGNWKGGITAVNRGLRWSSEYKHWRKSVLDRDGRKCRICQGTSNLHVHHIISISECAEIAFLPMNGVVLCNKHHYENDAAWKGKRFEKNQRIGRSLALIFTIPHQFQAYETPGNWAFTKSGTIVIFVSDTGNWKHEFLIAIHEAIEVMLCKERGITQQTVDSFDLQFELDRASGLYSEDSEPGDHPMAPYRKEHFFATSMERLIASELGVDWVKYGDAVVALHQTK